jgi:hypothetical protein
LIENVDCFTALIILAGEKENIPGVLPPWKLELEWGREGDCEGATVKKVGPDNAKC